TAQNAFDRHGTKGWTTTPVSAPLCRSAFNSCFGINGPLTAKARHSAPTEACRKAFSTGNPSSPPPTVQRTVGWTLGSTSSTWGQPSWHHALVAWPTTYPQYLVWAVSAAGSPYCSTAS